MKKILTVLNSLPFYFTLLFLLCCLYLLDLFTPTLKLFVTPDVFLSDLIHINYSLKHLLAEALRNNYFPYWNWDIGNGFPQIGESQIGAFYLPNILLLKFLPFDFAFNAGYVFTYYLSAIGYFLFLSRHLTSRLFCFFGALLFTFSAPMMMQIVHYNLLQSYSLIPICFYFFDLFIHSKNLRLQVMYGLLLSLLLTQQFFAGYSMTSFMTLLGLSLYGFVHIIHERKIAFAQIKSYFISTSLAMLGIGAVMALLSAIQLIPLIEFVQYSVRSAGSGDIAIGNSLHPRMFLTFLNFDFFGLFDSISNTRNQIALYSDIRNLAWDGNLFIGVAPLLMLAGSLPFTYKSKKLWLVGILAFIFLLFALGGYSPFKFLYGFPPFTFFRTPQRFTILVVFFLILLIMMAVSIMLRQVKRTHKSYYPFVYGLFILSFIGTIGHLFFIRYSFHPTTEVANVVKSEAYNFLKTHASKQLQDNNSTIFSLGNELAWYQTLIHKPRTKQDPFVYFQSDLNTYFNGVFDIPSSGIFFTSFFAPRKQYYVDGQISRAFLEELRKKTGINYTFDPVADYDLFVKRLYMQELELPTETVNLLRMKTVRYIVTPFKLSERNGLKKVHENTKHISGYDYYLRIYEVANTGSRFYTASNYYFANSVDDIENVIRTGTDVNRMVFGFEDVGRSVFPSKATIAQTEQTHNSISVQAKLETPGLLVASVNNYPGMTVYSGDQKLPVHEVNFNNMAVSLEMGNHELTFRYEPWWHPGAMYITVLAHLTVIGAIILLRRS